MVNQIVPKPKETIAQEVVAENRLAFVTAEYDRLFKAKEALQIEIDKKMSDYNIYMAQRDAETKKARADALALGDTMAKDKAELYSILKKFQDDKAAVDDERESLAIQRNQVKERFEAIRNFIVAIQRDITVLGI
jgi:hypothetical protein